MRETHRIQATPSNGAFHAPYETEEHQQPRVTAEDAEDAEKTMNRRGDNAEQMRVREPGRQRLSMSNSSFSPLRPSRPLR